MFAKVNYRFPIFIGFCAMNSVCYPFNK